MDEELKERLRGMQSECEDLLTDIMGIFPDGYRFTLVARHISNTPAIDIVITNDDADRAMHAIERAKDSMGVE